ncbi:MAG: OadG family protein [Dehalococcoidia bacterium]|nr:OadG family protein [Dehalococcoidia bacterium]
MSEDLAEAALLILMGMAVVFCALVILMSAIMIINRMTPDRGKKAEGPVLLEATESEDSDRGRIAALAVAVAKAMEREQEVTPEQGMVSAVGWAGEPSRWVVSGREQAMRSRGKAGRQWGRRSD